MENTTIVTVQEQKQVQMLNSGLITADRFINKNYLINIADQPVVPLDESEKSTNAIRLFKIVKLVYDKKENINDKLISVYSALQNIDSSALLVIESNGKEITFYIGVRSIDNAATASKILEKSFVGNFPGSTLVSMKNSEISGLMESVAHAEIPGGTRNVSCVTVIPSMRDEDKEKFVQGIEKFIDTMQGEKFTAVFVARPVSKEALELRKRGFEELYSSLSPFIKTSLSYGENYSKAVTTGMFENFSHSVNNSVSNTTGRNKGTNASFTKGTSHGSSFNVGGFGTNSGRNSSSTSGYSSGSSWSRSVTQGSADTTGSGTNTSDSVTNGTTRSLTVEHQNKSVTVLLEKIDEQLKRIKACEAFGVWECAAYFIADDIQTAVVAANAYKALMLGDDTQVENSFVNVWGIKNPENTGRVLEYIQYGQHPLIEIMPEMGFDTQYVTPGNFISGKELPLLMGIPHKSVTGLTVSNIAEFGRNVFIQNARPDRKKIRLGRIYHMGNVEDTLVNLDLDSLTSHCFITGSTGSGKSNTTYGLLERFIENDIPFLVVEPTKGEYKTAFGNVKDINIFTTNPLIGQMLKLNPFRFDRNIHVLEHLDRLIEIFNACWEMYAAMPAILKDAVEQIYIDKGWDLLNSVYMGDGEPVYPTFADLMKTLPNIINNSGYSSDTKGDYIGALVTRVTSLTNGISGQIFCDIYDIPDNKMFDENTIVDLSRVGSTETKSLIMGILVLKLSEYRMANASQANSGLKHITVLEEAHNLLKRSTPGSTGSDVVGKSVEMICNSIAEMRTYGEGFIIVDQSPTAVDIAAIKNTNTKILMRLPEKSDCEAVGNAAGLNEDQVKEMSRLGTGVAVVMQNNWLEAVLTLIDRSTDNYEKQITPVTYDSLKKLRGAVIRELMQQYIVDRKMDLDRVIARIENIDIAPYKKDEMKCCVRHVIGRLQKGRDIDFFCETLLNISCAKDVFDIIRPAIKRSQNDSERIYDEDSVFEWKETLKTRLRNYVDLPDDFNNTIVKYLLHTQELNEGAVDYLEIHRILY
ncbi:MAG: DUF87 domain-containing protein [Lachnospiraceae bacterium]|nr:DUF87 domain-containing protein [Lachnospiraceae bacterium]